MLMNIHNEESLRIRNKKLSSEWPFKIKVLVCHGLFKSIVSHTSQQNTCENCFSRLEFFSNRLQPDFKHNFHGVRDAPC
jgi:hypothetical protein